MVMGLACIRHGDMFCLVNCDGGYGAMLSGQADCEYPLKQGGGSYDI